MHVFQVQEFVEYLNETFKAIWDTSVAIEGEVTNFRISQNQWVNFDVKDENALVSVFMVRQRLGVPLSDGMRVRLYGQPRVYPKFGKFSFSADRVELVGEGAMRKALEALRARLEAEGLLDTSRKRTLPRIPKKIALVASRESAAYGDFCRIVNERWAGLEIDLYHVLVQGQDAPTSIMRALERVHAQPEQTYDAIVITRGGGSFEELMTFNDEALVRAVYASKIPTMVAIGHERDVTLCEEVADVRGSTPTDCARRLVPDKRDVLQEIAVMQERIDHAMQRIIDEKKRIIERAVIGMDHWVVQLRHRVERMTQSVGEASWRWRDKLAHRLERLLDQITAADPRKILERGYALVHGSNGELVQTTAQAAAAQTLSIRFKDGSVSAEVGSGPRSKNLRLL